MEEGDNLGNLVRLPFVISHKVAWNAGRQVAASSAIFPAFNFFKGGEGSAGIR